MSKDAEKFFKALKKYLLYMLWVYPIFVFSISAIVMLCGNIPNYSILLASGIFSSVVYANKISMEKYENL